jgi:hypothetical protein
MAANPGLDILSRRAILDVMQELASEPANVSYQEILAREILYRLNPVDASTSVIFGIALATDA